MVIASLDRMNGGTAPDNLHWRKGGQDHNTHLNLRQANEEGTLKKKKERKRALTTFGGTEVGGQVTRGRALGDPRGRERDPLVAGTSLKRVDAGWLLGRA